MMGLVKGGIVLGYDWVWSISDSPVLGYRSSENIIKAGLYYIKELNSIIYTKYYCKETACKQHSQHKTYSYFLLSPGPYSITSSTTSINRD